MPRRWALSRGGTNVAVGFQVGVFEYDPISRKYFESLYQNAPLNGLIDNTATPTSFSLASQPSSEVSSPVNYALKLVIRPQARSQNVILVAAEKNIVKPWGSA